MRKVQRHPRPAEPLFDLALLALAIPPEEPLRRRVFSLVAEHPGLHQRDIARRLGVRGSHAEYHLRQLTRAGLLRESRDDGYVRYFVQVQLSKPTPGGAVDVKDGKWLSLLRQARPLAILAHLLRESPQPMGELAQRVGVSASTLTYQVGKLERVGIVARRQEGTTRFVVLVDRDRLVRLLLEYEPPDDLIAGFEDLWREVDF